MLWGRRAIVRGGTPIGDASSSVLYDASLMTAARDLAARSVNGGRPSTMDTGLCSTRFPA